MSERATVWLARVLKYGMGLAGLALAGLVWWALNMEPYRSGVRHYEWRLEHKFVRPHELGWPGFNTLGANVDRWQRQRYWEAQKAAWRRAERKVARLHRIELPVETPPEPATLALR